jgi:diacylglycerol kinase (ATP)
MDWVSGIDMKVTMLVNESAGAGDHSVDDLRRQLEAAGHRVEVGSSKGRKLERAIRHAVERGDELVVAAGGDGTVGRVMKALTGRGLPLAILPLGTANNIATSLGIRGTPEELAARWTRPSRVHMSVGRVRGPWGETAFVESVGLGLLARLMSPEVVDGIDGLEAARDEARRLARSMRGSYWRMELDGEELSAEYLLVEAMNIRCAGPNVCLAVRERAGGGQLEVMLAGERERAMVEAHVLSEDELRAALQPRVGRRLRFWCEAEDLHVDDTHGEDLYEGGELMRVDVELTDRGVDILV